MEIGATIADYLDISEESIVAVIGCGGKTALIERLIANFWDKKVLVSPTTKMYPRNVGGIRYIGKQNAQTGKLDALSEHELAGLIPQYDIVLLEADGSRGLPCKGWNKDEPVIPGYCTHSIGVVTMNALGKAATTSIVHRLPEFLSLTGLREGEPITMEALTEMVCAPQGMFKNSIGIRILLVNQVEDGQAARSAKRFLRIIKEKYPEHFSKLLYGSVYQDSWWEV